MQLQAWRGSKTYRWTTHLEKAIGNLSSSFEWWLICTYSLWVTPKQQLCTWKWVPESPRSGMPLSHSAPQARWITWAQTTRWTGWRDGFHISAWAVEWPEWAAAAPGLHCAAPESPRSVVWLQNTMRLLQHCAAHRGHSKMQAGASAVCSTWGY